MSYWRDVSARAWKETRKAAKIESLEAVGILLIGQAVLGLVLWEATGDASLTTRIASAALPFLLIIPLFVWKIILTPAALAREISEAQNADLESLRAENERLRNQNSDPNHKKIEILLETVQALTARNIPEPQINQIVPAHLQDLRTETANSIRKRVFVIVKSMRTMENSFKTSRNSVLFGSHEDWDAHNNRLFAQSQEQAQRWQSELMPEAVALWNEMRRRVYGAPPYPRDHLADTALEHGMLAGVSPLNEAAIALERLARDMPG